MAMAKKNKEELKALLILKLREVADLIEQGQIIPVDYGIGIALGEIDDGQGQMVSVPLDVLTYTLRTTKREVCDG